MSVGVYLCACGGAIDERIAPDPLATAVARLPGVAYVDRLSVACGGLDREALVASIRARRPARVVVAACSPRDHEATFQAALEAAGMNGFLVALVNVREQVAWVTPDPEQAHEKAVAQIRAGVARALMQRPLARRTIPVEPGVVVIGAGPAGLTAARTLAESGRDVTLVERSPVVGGVPVRLDSLFPGLECGSCAVQPLVTAVLHGAARARVRLLVRSEVEARRGSFGNFTVRVRRAARFVDEARCIGCQECLPPCPATRIDGSGAERKAIDVPVPGGVPNAPVIDVDACVRSRGDACSRCADACPVPGTIDLDARDEVIEVRAGAIVVATGATEGPTHPARGHGRVPFVLSGAELERELARGRPGQPALRGHGGWPPRTVVLVHSPAGDPIARKSALKWGLRLTAELAGVQVIHVDVPAGADRTTQALELRAQAQPGTRFVHALDGDAVSVCTDEDGRPCVVVPTIDGDVAIAADLIVLAAPLAPAAGAGAIAAALGIDRDDDGFFLGRSALAPLAARTRGVFVAGSCRGPGDVGDAVTSGAAAAGLALAALAQSDELVVEPTAATIDAARCGGCLVCVGVCDARAIEATEARGAHVRASECLGCGACTAACPAAAISQERVGDLELFAEIGAALA